jgi:8-oxo-dGTP pyrophosphatase MutT (NUDIX family)
MTMIGRKKSFQTAAVLIPVYRGDNGEIRLVLVRRGVGGVHGSQLAFPGGKPEPGDRSTLDTALRETEEEIGLKREMIHILSPLPAVETRTTGFRIFPYLARIVRPPTWRRQEREIAEIIDVAVGDLVRPEAHGQTLKQFPTWPEPQAKPFYRVGSHQVWGVTYRMLRPLIPRLMAGEWQI